MSNPDAGKARRMSTERTWCALVATLALLLGACSGGPTNEEYFQDLETIVQTADADFEAWQERGDAEMSEVTNEEEAAEALRPLLDEALTIMNTAHAAIEELSAPDEVADAHDAFVGAVTNSRAAMQGLVDDFDEVGVEEIIERLEGEEFAALDDAQEQACFDLQRLADDAETDVDLVCGD
jgi:hypothetical protein